MLGHCACISHLETLFLVAELVVKTNHHSLKYIFTQPLMNSRLGIWVVVLSNFHVTLEYVPRLHSVVADALSQMPQALALAISTTNLNIPKCFKDEDLTNKGFEDAFRVLKSFNPSPSEIKIYASYSSANDFLFYLERSCVPHNAHLWKTFFKKIMKYLLYHLLASTRHIN